MLGFVCDGALDEPLVLGQIIDLIKFLINGPEASTLQIGLELVLILGCVLLELSTYRKVVVVLHVWLHVEVELLPNIGQNAIGNRIRLEELVLLRVQPRPVEGAEPMARGVGLLRCFLQQKVLSWCFLTAWGYAKVAVACELLVSICVQLFVVLLYDRVEVLWHLGLRLRGTDFLRHGVALELFEQFM